MNNFAESAVDMLKEANAAEQNSTHELAHVIVVCTYAIVYAVLAVFKAIEERP